MKKSHRFNHNNNQKNNNNAHTKKVRMKKTPNVFTVAPKCYQFISFVSTTTIKHRQVPFKWGERDAGTNKSTKFVFDFSGNFERTWKKTDFE